MSVHNFEIKQDFISIDKLPDFRTEEEKMFTPLALYNHDNPDIAYAERMAEEIINISGAWITVFHRTNNSGTSDELWEEDPDPTYKNGTRMKALFTPEPAKVELTKWGLDTQNQTNVIFSRAILFKEFGRRMLRPGDVIEIPHNTLSPIQTSTSFESDDKLDKFRILDAADSGMFRYRWLYYNCKVENLLGDITIQPENR